LLSTTLPFTVNELLHKFLKTIVLSLKSLKLLAAHRSFRAHGLHHGGSEVLVGHAIIAVLIYYHNFWEHFLNLLGYETHLIANRAMGRGALSVWATRVQRPLTRTC